MIITVSVVLGFQNEIEQKVTGFSAPIQITGEFLNSSFENKPFTDSELTRETVASFPFVEHIQAFALKPAILKQDEDFEGIVLKGIDSSYRVDFFSKCMQKGRFISFNDEEQTKEVVISASLADKLKLDTGAFATIWFVQDPPLIKKVQVVGIYQTDIEEIDQYFVLTDLNIPIQVAVMGCVVNGPGEAREADLGIAAGRKRGHLFVKGEVVKVVPEPEMVEALVEWAQIIADGGVEEALRRKDDGAAAEAEADRMALLDDKGDDANNADERIQIIRKLD